MNQTSSNWYKKPSKKIVTIVVIVWIISMALVLIGTSDWFKNAVPSNIILLLVLPSLLAIVNLLINYNKHKVKDNS